MDASRGSESEFEFFWLSFDELDSFSLLVLVLPVGRCFVVVIGL